MLPKASYKSFVKETARSLGFDFCGIARAGRLDDDADRLEKWLGKGFHAQMEYMSRHFDLRVDPRKLLPGAKSVITLMLNYYPEHQQEQPRPKISKYAYGRDYHQVIREKLGVFLSRLKEQVGEVQGRGFVDSAPVLERSWAQRSGLGWIGKNGNLISRSHGSFFFLSTLITDLELEADEPYARDYCGTCTRCIDACPTDAILPGKVIDAGRCISYFTIELKEALIPGAMKGRFENHLFGCDVCQDVCPWNRFASATKEPGFTPVREVLEYSEKDWEELTEASFRIIFRDSPLKRSGYAGIKRNLAFLRLQK